MSIRLYFHVPSLYSSLVILPIFPTSTSSINIWQMGLTIVPVRKLCDTNYLLLNHFTELYKMLQNGYAYKLTFFRCCSTGMEHLIMALLSLLQPEGPAGALILSVAVLSGYLLPSVFGWGKWIPSRSKQAAEAHHKKEPRIWQMLLYHIAWNQTYLKLTFQVSNFKTEFY